MTTIKNVTGGGELKSLIRFLSANKIDNYNRVGGECKRIYRTSQKVRIINVFLESLLSESFLELGITVQLTPLGCPPILLVSGPAVGAAQILIWSCSGVFLPPVPTALRVSVFSFVGTLSGL